MDHFSKNMWGCRFNIFIRFFTILKRALIGPAARVCLFSLGAFKDFYDEHYESREERRPYLKPGRLKGYWAKNVLNAILEEIKILVERIINRFPTLIFVL